MHNYQVKCHIKNAKKKNWNKRINVVWKNMPKYKALVSLKYVWNMCPVECFFVLDCAVSNWC